MTDRMEQEEGRVGEVHFARSWILWALERAIVDALRVCDNDYARAMAWEVSREFKQTIESSLPLTIRGVDPEPPQDA